MALELNNVGWYFAENYANLQLAIDAIPATGGTLILSNKVYDLSASPLVIDKPITIIGQGGEDTYLQHYKTLLYSNSATADMVTVNHPSFMMSGVGFKNTNANVTAGSGLKIDIRGTHPTNNGLFPDGVGSNFNLRECTFNGFYRNVDIVNAFEWNITDCMSQNSKEAGIHVASEQLPDGGDGNITGCQILSGKYGGGNAILQNSSGGLKVTNTKINQGRHANAGKFVDTIVFLGDYANTPVGVQASTVILLLSGLSIENFTGYAVNIDGLPAVNISDCQIDSYITTPGIFNFTNCTRGIIGGITAIKRGTTANFASFTGCSDWEILNSMTASWGASAYSFTNCTNMRKAADTVVI